MTVKYAGRNNYEVTVINSEGRKVTEVVHVTKNAKKFSRNIVSAVESFEVQDCHITERQIVEGLQKITTQYIPNYVAM